MSRDLINAQAWKNGREKVCRMCRWFSQHMFGSGKYDWDRCSKSNHKDFEKWQGDKCKNFQKKENNELWS